MAQQWCTKREQRVHCLSTQWNTNKDERRWCWNAMFWAKLVDVCIFCCEFIWFMMTHRQGACHSFYKLCDIAHHWSMLLPVSSSVASHCPSPCCHWCHPVLRHVARRPACTHPNPGQHWQNTSWCSCCDCGTSQCTSHCASNGQKTKSCALNDMTIWRIHTREFLQMEMFHWIARFFSQRDIWGKIPHFVFRKSRFFHVCWNTVSHQISLVSRRIFLNHSPSGTKIHNVFLNLNGHLAKSSAKMDRLVVLLNKNQTLHLTLDGLASQMRMKHTTDVAWKKW